MKLSLRKKIVEEKEKFAKSLDYNYMVGSSVHRGFYYGLGGEKEIALPSLFDLISEAVSKVVQAKAAYDKKREIDGGSGEEYGYRVDLEKSFKTKRGMEQIQSIEFGFEMPEDQWNLVVTNFKNGETAIIKDAGTFNGRVVKELILEVIRLYDSQGELSKYGEQIEEKIAEDIALLIKEGYINE